MKTSLKIISSIILLFLLSFPCAAFAWECNGHVALGVPGAADQLLCREGYAVGYDYDRKVPIWVAYHLTREGVEKKYKRSNRFKVDKEIPEAYRSTLSDYKGSGYDRGHMAPAATVDFSETSMQESFLLTNMTPQLPGFNRQGWRYLEAYIRDWAVGRGNLYVVTGSLFDGEIETIGDHVSIPTGFFKVVYDPAAEDGIAFIVPHRNISKAEVPSFIVSIDEVEARTGFDFISLLPDDLEDDIEDDVEVMWVASANPSNGRTMAAETSEEKNMAKEREGASLEESLHTEIIVNQALIDLLVTKGIITHEELMEQIQVIRKELQSDSKQEKAIP